MHSQEEDIANGFWSERWHVVWLIPVVCIRQSTRGSCKPLWEHKCTYQPGSWRLFAHSALEHCTYVLTDGHRSHQVTSHTVKNPRWTEHPTTWLVQKKQTKPTNQDYAGVALITWSSKPVQTPQEAVMRYRAFTQQLWSLLREKKIQTRDVSQRHQVHSKCKLLGMQEAKLGLKNQ